MPKPISHPGSQLSSLNGNEPVVLCAADDRYVKPLTVMLHSAAQNLRNASLIHAIVLDGGIGESSWVGIQESLANLPIRLYQIRPGLQQVRDLNISHHITHTAYLRLLAGRLLPTSIDRAIYFDSDLLIQDDISKLWQMELGDNFALAVPDIACPFVDARHANCNFRKSSPYFSAVSPVRNWKQLQLDPSAYYFNSGMMILNIKRMRDETIESSLLKCLRDNQKFVWCWDQYALNVVFAQQWQPLPLHWNAGAHLFEFPDETFSPFHVDDFRRAKQRPSIIHYTTEWKPWDYRNSHPLRELFFEQLDQTAFAGWRPGRPRFKFRKSWDAFWAQVIKHVYIRYQSFSARLSNYSDLPASQLPRVAVSGHSPDASSMVASSS